MVYAILFLLEDFMKLGLSFFINSFFLGVGLAMDAFSVSLANGLNEPFMKRKKMLVISATFAFFQALMPLLGWFCVHSLLHHFKTFEKFIPWIALFLLCFIGVKMLSDGMKNKDCEECVVKLTPLTLFVQGIATSIDALSVGFTIAEYSSSAAVLTALIIALVTFIICYAGLIIGKKFGTKLSNKAQLFGGAILIFIGIEIFVTNIF